MQRAQASVTAALTLLGGTLILMGQYGSLPTSNIGGGLWFTLAGGFLFLLGVLHLRAPEKFSFFFRWLEKIGDWLSIRPWQVLLLGVSPFFAFLASLAAGESGKMRHPALALLAWSFAIFAAWMGAEKENEPPLLARKRLFFLLAAGIAALAFLPRGIGLERLPYPLTGDEASSGLYAASIARGDINNPFIAGWYEFPSLFFFIPALSIRLFGQTAQAIRVVSAIAGALTVAATYFLGRALFDKKTAAFAALFLGALHFHIHFSRIALNNIWDGLWYVLAIGALWRGWQTGNRRAFLFAGAFAGIAQYFYPSARTLLALILAFLLLALIFDRPRLKANAKNLLLAFLLFLVLTLPLARYFLHHPGKYFAPLHRVSIFGRWLQYEIQNTGFPAWRIFLRQTALGFGAFLSTPLRAWYMPETALLRPLMETLFLIGLIFLLFQKSKLRALLLLLWIAAIGVIGALSESTPAAQRYVAAAPALTLLAGYGLSETLKMFQSLWEKRSRLLALLAILLALYIGADDLNFYFFRYTPRSLLVRAHAHDVIAQHIADFLRNRSPDRPVVFLDLPSMGYKSIPNIQYLTPQFSGIDIPAPWGSEENPRLQGDAFFFIIPPEREEDLAKIQRDYPNGDLLAEPAADTRLLFWIYAYPSLPESP